MSGVNEARRAEGRTVENIVEGSDGSLVVTFTDGTGLRIWSAPWSDNAFRYAIAFLFGMLLGIVVSV